MPSHGVNLYQTAQIREFERLAAERFALTGSMLMQRAGKAAFELLRHRYPHARTIAIFCGGGNNGGDGYALALLAHRAGLDVTVWQVGSHAKLKAEAKETYSACKEANVSCRPFHADSDIGHPDVIVDAICGMGITKALREDAAIAVAKIGMLKAPVLAIDIPTGINADTGSILGAAVRADVTITFIGLKLGLFTGDGASCSGSVVCDDLQLPVELFESIEPVASIIQLKEFAHYLKPRPRNWHKGLSGHVLIVGGDLGYAGAPRMAGEAALRVGAGLVTLATRPEHAFAMNLRMPELMCRGITDAKQLEPLLEKATVVVVGPGLGQSEWSKSLWQVVQKHDGSKVVDADGLNLLAQHPAKSDDWVLTPHPGEAARLLNASVSEIQQDRLQTVCKLAKEYGGVSVLKGSGSLVYAAGALPALCNKGNPGMASAGMGDVLSGVIGGLIAQGIPLHDAARLGVYLHAVAGDLAAVDKGERGLVATDLMPYLRKLVNL